MDQRGVFAATEVFADVLRGAKVISVDPRECIPFISIRQVVRSGVERIKFSYAENDDGALANGAVCGASLPTVVSLCGPFSQHAMEYFVKEQGLSVDDATSRAESRQTWYGIVDGSHRLQALLEMQKEMPQRWAGFKWSVLLLQGAQSLQVLRAFARAQNMRQTNEHYIETTIYDLLRGLQVEVKRLTAEGGGRQPGPKLLAESYSYSKDRTSTSMRSLAAVSLKLDEEVVSCVGDIVNFESAELACTYYAVRGKTNFTESSIHQQVDCRVYRNFVTTTSLRQAGAFINACGEDSKELQMNTLHRARGICRASGFKQVPGSILSEQFGKEKAALKEARKFEKLLRSSLWPLGMEKLKENLLRSTVLDSDVEGNEGNEIEILPVIIQLFRSCVPQKAALLEARYYATVEEGIGADLDAPPVRAAEHLIPGAGQAEGEGREDAGFMGNVAEVIDAGAAQEKAVLTQHDEGNAANEMDGHEVLHTYGISCFEMTWQQYNRTLHSNTDGLYDLILTEPPRGLAGNKSRLRKGFDEVLSARDMQEFAQFAQRVLVPGGYLLVFTQAKYFKEWVMQLCSNDFTCAEYPFVVLRDSKGMQRENGVLFPQNVCDLVVMAVSPGKNAKGFQVDFNESYRLLPCTYKRKFAAIDAVPVVERKLRQKGCRSLVCSSEKNSNLLAELIVTFSPPNGTVLEPFAGTMTLGAACLSIRRRCTLIEKDRDCFKQAFQRLVRIAKAEELQGDESKGSGGYDYNDTDRVEVKGNVGSCSAPSQIIGSESGDQENGANVSAYAVSSSGEGISIPSVPSSPVEKPTQCSQAGEGEAKLTMKGVVVGSAIVEMEEGKSGGFRKVLHGEDLSRHQKGDEHLVVVWNVRIKEECKKYGYPYMYGGIEEPPQVLSGMESGFHAWDLNEILFEE